MSAEIGGDDTMARLDQAGDHVDVAMDVVRGPVQQMLDLAVAMSSSNYEILNSWMHLAGLRLNGE
jgi:hypothetical protein